MSSTGRLFHCITTLHVSRHEILQAGIKTRMTLCQSDILHIERDRQISYTLRETDRQRQRELKKNSSVNALPDRVLNIKR